MVDLHDDEAFMRLAMAQAEGARGNTGDNPWVGCAIIGAAGELLGQGHTQGPGEHHAEISAAEDAAGRGVSIVGATLYSTLEPCSFHGRTPACAHAIAKRGIARVVIALRDPHPRVDGAGIAILRAAGVEVMEGVCERDVRLQLAPWILAQHPGEIVRFTRSLESELTPSVRLQRLQARYGLATAELERLLREQG